MKHTIRSIIVFWSILCIAILLPVCRVSADIGPKPSMELHIENPPEGVYYVDLLVEANTPPNPDDYENRRWDPVMFDALIGYYEDGYRARLRGDFGVNFDIEQSNDNHINDFTYMLPDSFKVIIVTEQGECIASENSLDPMRYNCVATFNCADLTLTESKDAIRERVFEVIRSILLEFLITCSLTLLLEGIVLLLFRLKLKKQDWKVFALTNLATQILLYIILWLNPNWWIKAEVVILVIETVVFQIWMHPANCAKRIRLGIAAVLANLISAITGFLPYVVRFFYRF
ncbi:MAG: hypothetical protein E7503_02140 [Ruminococcus sp.]|nr:hypothetical protein [Ruminococcus sp.]